MSPRPLLLLLTPLLGNAAWGCPNPHGPTSAAVVLPQQDVELEKRKAEAGNDTLKLWKFYEWCRDTKREKEAKAALRKIVKLDPQHKDANVALGHVFYDGKWFPTQKQLDEYKKEQELAAKKAQGLVLWKEQWVPAEDVPFLERGLVRAENGEWVDAEEAKKLAEGWTRQDLDWIPPDEKGKIEEGLWKCDGQWLALSDADACHAELTRWWRIPFERFHLYTTCERDLAVGSVKRELENGFDELVRAYGLQPSRPVAVIVLRDRDQYSKFASGDEDTQRMPTDARGLSSVHHAYFADNHFEVTESGPVLGLGVGYWDAATKDGPKWGVHSVRHALGLSFAEALDPSQKTLDKHRKTPMRGEAFWDAFYAEKRIPAWFSYGAAAYAERYYRDNNVGIGGDPLWTRKWSAGNIRDRGGLRPLKQILEFDLTVDGGADSEKLINEAGLVVAFLLDGGNAAIAPKLGAFQEAIRSGKDRKGVGEAAKALEAEIMKQEAELKKFAGF